MYRNIFTNLTLIGPARRFPPPVVFGSDFVSLNFTKSFQTFLEVKIDINLVNLTLNWQAHWVL